MRIPVLVLPFLQRSLFEIHPNASHRFYNWSESKTMVFCRYINIFDVRASI